MKYESKLKAVDCKNYSGELLLPYPDKEALMYNRGTPVPSMIVSVTKMMTYGRCKYYQSCANYSETCTMKGIN